MKKIVFVIPELFGGGAERVTAVLADRLSGIRGLEVHLISYRITSGDYPVSDAVHRHSGEKDLRDGGHQILAKLKWLRGLLRQIGPDCVISLAGPSALSVLTLAMLGTGIPLILSERNDPGRYPRGKLLRVLRMCSYALCDGIVFQTGDARDYFPAFIRKKGTVICNPIMEGLPERFEGERSRRIVNWCRLEPQKNLELLLDAFGDIADRFPEVTLDIYGEGSEREALMKKAAAMGLGERVTLHGYCTDVHERVRDAALFVSSSDYEGMSNSMLEAIAMGIPSICTDCPIGGAGEIIRHGVNGLLVPVRDRAALSDAMERVLSDGALAQSISGAGVRLRSELSGEAIARKWLAFAELVSGKE